MPVSEELFRSALSRFASGVTVVTTLDASNNPVGLTVSSFCSLSLSPPLILICIDKETDSHPWFAHTGFFIVNILAEDQEELSRLFAAPTKDGAMFSRIDHTTLGSRIPALNGALATLECKLWQEYEGGDHTIYVGHVQKANVGEGKPLLYFRGGYSRLQKPKGDT